MASPEDVIEPAAQSSAAQNLGRRRFTKDQQNLSPDEIDGLMSSGGKRKASLMKTLNLRSELHIKTVMAVSLVFQSSKSQRVALSSWCIVFLS